jgi:hypothetical protein
LEWIADSADPSSIKVRNGKSQRACDRRSRSNHATSPSRVHTRPHPEERTKCASRRVGNTTTASHPSRHIATRCSSGRGLVLCIAERETAIGRGGMSNYLQERCRSSTRIASGTAHKLKMHTRSANRLSPLATTRPRRSDQRVDQGLFALRRGPEKAGHAGKDTTACSAIVDASIAVTGVHKRSRLIDQARRAAARHTADVIPHHLLTTGRRS